MDFAEQLMRGRGRTALHLSSALALLTAAYLMVVSSKYLATVRLQADRICAMQRRLHQDEASQSARARERE